MSLLDPVPFKPFTKIVNFTGAPSATYVTLTDTGGTPIKCNYIAASVAGTATYAGYFLVTPSGISSNPQITLGNGASGTLGKLGSIMNPVELFLGGGDACSSVYVELFGSVAAPLIISYGVKVPINPLRNIGSFPGA
jgi:hypothetical protein